MARLYEPEKHDPISGRLLSHVKWARENRQAKKNGNTYYLSESDLQLVKRAGRKLKLKKNSEIIRAAIQAILTS